MTIAAWIRVAASLTAGLIVATASSRCNAADLKILTAGAYKPVIMAVAPAFEQRTGVKLDIENDTAGALLKRIEGGETFDLAILPSAALQSLAAQHLLAPGAPRPLAKVGIGVAVLSGAPHPDIHTVPAFKSALMSARAVAYLDPAAGGSSGIYVEQLFQRLGLGATVLHKAVRVNGGLVAQALVTGQADLAVHQLSELMLVKGVDIVGPLPASLQHYTAYAAGMGAHSGRTRDAQKLQQLLASTTTAPIVRASGMLPAR